MCGIVGMMSLDGTPADVGLLMRMREAVRHRGPDDRGAVLLAGGTETGLTAIEFKDERDPVLGERNISRYSIGFAHRRLSILDLSPKGHQPMGDDQGRSWIIHNGEIYNYLEIREELISIGRSFRSNTDTEVILKAYQEWGPGCLAKFNGMWAFAIWDEPNKTLFFSRDRFGVKPFYYYRDEHIFLFASEIKSLLCYGGLRRRPNEAILYDFLTVGLEDHTDETFFEDIRQLKGGEFALFDYAAKTFRKDRYYILNKKEEPREKESDYYREFSGLFFDSVNIRLRSDVPVGSCLSGGLDSSSVVCAISQIAKARAQRLSLETFTASWANESIDERVYAEDVARAAGAHGNYISPTPEDLQRDLLSLIRHQEEPFTSLSVFAQWCVMKKARERGVPVLLDGQGGDEVFLGYERYYAWFLMSLFKKGKFGKFFRETLRGAKNSKLSLPGLAGYFAYFNFPRIRARYVKRRTQDRLSAKFLKRYSHLERSKDFRKIKDVFDLQRTEIQETQLGHLLKYADRNSMAFAIESRLPFLDYRLVEFALSVPPEFKIKNGWTKNIIREGMKGIIPESIRTRKTKIGFEVPQEKLLKSLQPWLKEASQTGMRSEAYINPRWLRTKIESGDFAGNEFWRALSAELWMREFFGREKP